ncbi:MAG: hypothetical protein L6407_06795, partial [Candidatus Delongbacteria bacterium]|nr:hypothetical protein [Candidatus Delongbacteria bacterium]
MKKILLILLVVITNAVLAMETAGMAGAFLRYGLDARSESLGRAMTADRKSAFSIFFNPSAASAVSEKQILTGMKILSMDRNFAYLTYVHPMRENATISVGILYSGTSDIEGRDKDGDQFATYSYNENMFYLNFGLKPKEFLSIGVSTKILWARYPEFDANSETVNSLTFAFDAGCNFFIPAYQDIVFGFVARNVKGKNSWDSSTVWTDGTATTDYYPETFSLGVSWNPEFNKDINFYGDINSNKFKDYGYGFGMEWSNKFEDKDSAIALRMGTI